MSLTYQPFASLPEVEALSEELNVNVTDPERLASGMMGMGLCAAGICLRGSQGLKWLLLGLGAALIHRGTSGHCPLYKHFMHDNRHRASLDK